MKEIMTNWDAKKVFSEFKIPLYFPNIYIDEYWDYHISLLNLSNEWNEFLQKFIDEKFTYSSFIKESHRIILEGSKLMFNCPQTEIFKNIKQSDFEQCGNLPMVSKGKLPKGKYLSIDIHNAFDYVYKYLGVFNETYKDTYDLIKNITPYTIFHNLKRQRIKLYRYGLPNIDIDKIYQVLNSIILPKLYNCQSPILQYINKHCELVGRTSGDTLIYKYNDSITPDIVKENYTYNDISFHITTLDIKDFEIFNKELKGCKETYENKESYYVIGKYRYIHPYIFPPIIKLTREESLSKMDLAIGYEDKIFFYLDETDIKEIK